jgi:hypothetical protein
MTRSRPGVRFAGGVPSWRIALLGLLAGCGEKAATPADVCEAVANSVTACGTGTAPETASCEEIFSDCSQEQLDGLVAFYDCIAAECDGSACVQHMEGVDGACLDGS